MTFLSVSVVRPWFRLAARVCGAVCIACGMLAPLRAVETRYTFSTLRLNSLITVSELITVGPDDSLYVRASTFSPAASGIARINPATGEVKFYPLTSASFGTPASDGLINMATLGVVGQWAADAQGNLYLTDATFHVVRRLSLEGGVVITVAGRLAISGALDGMGGDARFNRPYGLVASPEGDFIVSDTGNHCLRRVTKAGEVSLFAGNLYVAGEIDGSRDAARFNSPTRLTVDEAGNCYVFDGNVLRKVARDGRVSSLFGSNRQIALEHYVGMVADRKGAILLPTQTQIKALPLDSTELVVIAGSTDASLVNGYSDAARFEAITGIGVGSDGVIYLSANHAIRVGTPWKAPTLTQQPHDASVLEGEQVTLRVVASGVPEPTIQWFKDGAVVSGATGAQYSFRADPGRAGRYTAVATNEVGHVTSAAAQVAVAAAPPVAMPPSIGTAPVSQVLAASGTTLLSVTAAGTGPLRYQWQRDGAPIAGGTGSTQAVTAPGAYRVVVTNDAGSVTSEPAVIGSNMRLVNIATRGYVGAGAGAGLVAGFVVKPTGAGVKRFLVRGVGPTLGVFGVPGVLAQPELSVFRGSRVEATNSRWETGPDAALLPAAAQSVGAFPLAPGASDAALLFTAEPGSYTVQLEGATGSSGGALLEVYELDGAVGQLINLSTRGQVTAAENLTAGFVLTGTLTSRVLVRAIGPGLGQFGLAGFLPRPTLTVFSGATRLASNAGWSTSENAAEIARVTESVGGFALPGDSADAVLLLTLAPGSYTAEIGGGGGAGVALVEVYFVP